MSDSWRVTAEWDKLQESREWIDRIPAIRFPADWHVQVIPPFAGALVRFRVNPKTDGISVYLDGYDRLGSFGAPYWEIHPYAQDVARFAIDDIDGLLAAIQEVIDAKDSFDD